MLKYINIKYMKNIYITFLEWINIIIKKYCDKSKDLHKILYFYFKNNISFMKKYFYENNDTAPKQLFVLVNTKLKYILYL